MTTTTLPGASKLLTIPETAERMGVSRSHVYNLIWSGELKFVNIAKRKTGRTKMRVSEDAIAELEMSRTKQYPRRGPRAGVRGAA